MDYQSHIYLESNMEFIIFTSPLKYISQPYSSSVLFEINLKFLLEVAYLHHCISLNLIIFKIIIKSIILKIILCRTCNENGFTFTNSIIFTLYYFNFLGYISTKSTILLSNITVIIFILKTEPT